MNEKRVRYFSNTDMSIGFYLDRMKLVVDSVDNSNQVYDINDIFEFSNIIKFIDNGLFSTKWPDEYIDELKSLKRPILEKILRKYFVSLDANQTLEIATKLDRDYYQDFIEKISQYNIGDKINDILFDKLLVDSDIPIWDILESKYLVEKYPDVIKSKFLANPHNFETFLSNYTYSHNKRKIYIPKNILKQEMLILCNEYIDSEDANTNYLNILLTPIKGITDYINIDTKTKLKIKNRVNQIENELFGQRAAGGGLKIKMAVLSSEKAYKKEISDSSPTDMIAYIDGSWINKYYDFPTLLNNIQNLYDLFSEDLISELPSFPNLEMGIFERNIGVKTINSYEASEYFNLKQQFTTMKIRMISELLSKKNITIEDMIDWFFKSYSKEEFGIEWLPLNMPSRKEIITNKTATLFRIEESIRTQYAVLMAENKIDSDIVDMTNTPPISGLVSNIDKKYAYLADNDISNSILFLLFSSQSGIVYINEDFQSHSFISLIYKNKLKISDFHDHQKPRIEYLINNKVIKENKNGVLQSQDINELYIYKKLFTYGVISYTHSKEKIQTALDKMQIEDRVVFGSSLFSIQESDYLNFVLNNSLYDNSWAIRNSYQHGAPTHNNKERYMFDYNMALVVLLQYVIKINDELSTKKKLDGENVAYCDIDLGVELEVDCNT